MVQCKYTWKSEQFHTRETFLEESFLEHLALCSFTRSVNPFQHYKSSSFDSVCAGHIRHRLFLVGAQFVVI